MTNINGFASFISIYPGWYPGRAPHLHFEFLSNSGNSLLVTQTAFPEDISKMVYRTSNYNGDFDTSNNSDFAFSNSLDENLPDSLEGNITDGFTFQKIIRVSG